MSLPRLKEHADALAAIGDSYRAALKPPEHGDRVPTAFMACGFAGGFGLGARSAGFKVIGGVESAELPFAVRTAQQGWNVLVEPQANWSNGALARKLKEALRNGHGSEAVPDALLMNPPCSAYAKNGKRGGMADPVMCNLHSCIELGFAMAPTVWAWELVPGIFESADGREFLDGLAKRAAGAGYRPYAFLTTSAIHGGFQRRARFHFIASKVALDFGRVLASQPTERLGWRTVAQAIGSEAAPLPKLNSRVVTAGSLDAVLAHVPPGTYVNQVPDSVLARVYKPRGKAWTSDMGRPGVSRIRAMWDRPSATIVGGPSVVHPDEDRFLTVRENARLMGFPDDWEFPEGSQGYAEVGKGLTVHTARFVCEAIIDGLKAGTASEPCSALDVVDFRDRSVAPGLTSDESFKREWYQARHGTPWEGNNRTPGRPPGSGRAKSTQAVQAVRIASDSPAVRTKCEEFSLICVPLAEAIETDVAVVEADFAGAILAAFSLGACRAKRRVLCCPVDGLALPGIEVVGSVQGALDLVAAHAAPMLRAKLVRQLSELPDGLLADAISALAELVASAVQSEPDEDEPEDDDPSAG